MLPIIIKEFQYRPKGNHSIASEFFIATGDSIVDFVDVQPKFQFYIGYFTFLKEVLS